jgi:hypothetical protein
MITRRLSIRSGTCDLTTNTATPDIVAGGFDRVMNPDGSITIFNANPITLRRNGLFNNNDIRLFTMSNGFSSPNFPFNPNGIFGFVLPANTLRVPINTTFTLPRKFFKIRIGNP